VSDGNPSKRARQRVKLPRDIANIAKRLQDLPSGDYTLVFTVNDDGGMTWRLAELGKTEGR